MGVFVARLRLRAGLGSPGGEADVRILSRVRFRSADIREVHVAQG
jgi:hypothetical protein